MPAEEDRRCRRGVHPRHGDRSHQSVRRWRSRRGPRRWQRGPVRSSSTRHWVGASSPGPRRCGQARRRCWATTSSSSRARAASSGTSRRRTWATSRPMPTRAGASSSTTCTTISCAKGPVPWPGTAAYIDPGTPPPNPSTSTINTSFPKGAALADWMVNRGASTSPRPDGGLRAAALRDRGPRGDPELDLHRQEHPRPGSAAASGNPVHDVQHAG